MISDVGYLQGAHEIYGTSLVKISPRVKSVIRMANAPAMTEISEAEFRKVISKPLVKVGNFRGVCKTGREELRNKVGVIPAQRMGCLLLSRENISSCIVPGLTNVGTLVVGEHQNLRDGPLHLEHGQHPSTSFCVTIRVIMLTVDAPAREAHGARVRR